MNGSTRYSTEDRKVDGTAEGATAELGELVLSPPEASPPREYFKAIQKWQGTVIDISADTFRAILSPISGRDKLEQEAEMYLEDVTEDERPFVERGAVFYWSIGYMERPSGRVRESVLRFRRLPAWTESEIEKGIAYHGLKLLDE